MTSCEMPGIGVFLVEFNQGSEEHALVGKWGILIAKDDVLRFLPYKPQQAIDLEEKIPDSLPHAFTKRAIRKWNIDQLINDLPMWISSLQSTETIPVTLDKKNPPTQLLASHLFGKALIHLDLVHGWFDHMVNLMAESDDPGVKRLCSGILLELLRTPVTTIFVQYKLRDPGVLETILTATGTCFECHKTMLWIQHLIVVGAGHPANTRAIKENIKDLLSTAQLGMRWEAETEHKLTFPVFSYTDYLKLMESTETPENKECRQWARTICRYSMLFDGVICTTLMA